MIACNGIVDAIELDSHTWDMRSRWLLLIFLMVNMLWFLIYVFMRNTNPYRVFLCLFACHKGNMVYLSDQMHVSNMFCILLTNTFCCRSHKDDHIGPMV